MKRPVQRLLTAFVMLAAPLALAQVPSENFDAKGEVKDYINWN